MARSVLNASQEGLGYFLRRASAMSLEDARNVLNLETARSDSYYGAWFAAVAICRMKAERFPDHNWDLMPSECYIAIACYTLDRPNVAHHLDAWCRIAQPTASSWRRFPYKSLWCFLVRAFHMLPDFTVSHVFSVVRRISDAPLNSVVLTEFVSASVLFQTPNSYSGPDAIHLVFFSLPPHVVRDISLYSVRSNHLEVLIWPFCTFKICRMSSDAFALFFSWESLPHHLPRELPGWPWTVV